MNKPELTKREFQVLTLMAQGKHNNEIATILGISEHTAKFHVNAVLVKTGQTTRLGAVICCLKHGMITLDSLMTEIPLVPYTLQTTMSMVILEENKQAYDVDINNMVENITNDIVDELFSEDAAAGLTEEQAKVKVTAVLKDYLKPQYA